jgi:hypothetical protein
MGSVSMYFVVQSEQNTLQIIGVRPVKASRNITSQSSEMVN